MLTETISTCTIPLIYENCTLSEKDQETIDIFDKIRVWSQRYDEKYNSKILNTKFFEPFRAGIDSWAP
jgi:hypothetical protein